MGGRVVVGVNWRRLLLVLFVAAHRRPDGAARGPVRQPDHVLGRLADVLVIWMRGAVVGAAAVKAFNAGIYRGMVTVILNQPDQTSLRDSVVAGTGVAGVR